MPSVTHGNAPRWILRYVPIRPSGPITATELYRTFGSVRVALRQPEDHVEVVLTGEVGDVVGGRAGHGLRQFQVELARAPPPPGTRRNRWAR